ncbi:Helitron helicase-like protein [Phytophthora palmivora]|uniref:Helitron helicase-like protein n=1 Tax=Phytophthora palmivora TaxID=4796 RepID=A0A2P4Y1K5_9STRA|nr:Helitron helicase-like protein [Phytophthora palmivora]
MTKIFAKDRDIVARVFMHKLKKVNKDLDEGLLGIQVTRVHVVEYQKRGLPHAHIFLIFADDVDQLASAKLTDKDKHQELFVTVLSRMLQVPAYSKIHAVPV